MKIENPTIKLNLKPLNKPIIKPTVEPVVKLISKPVITVQEPIEANKPIEEPEPTRIIKPIESLGVLETIQPKIGNDYSNNQNDNKEHQTKFSKLKAKFLAWWDKWWKKSKPIIMKSLPILAILIVLITSGLAIKVYSDYNLIPNVKDNITNSFNQEASVIVDRNGLVLYDYKEDAKKEKIPLAQIPTLAQHALLVREQERFYKDPNGIPWYNLAGAIVNCGRIVVFRSKENCRGGSGLFQQIIKNTTDDDSQTIGRKYKELLQAVKASQDLNKDDILEIYFNNITFGRNSTGIQAGSKLFFGEGIDGKGVKALTPHRACFLAAMPNLPDDYTAAVFNKMQTPEITSPRTTRNWTYLKKIIDDCLDKLSTVELVDGQKPTITKEESEKEKAIPFEKYGFLEKDGFSASNKYPFLLEYIEEELSSKFVTKFPNQSDLRTQLLNGAFTIKTTFDLNIQNKLETAVNLNKGKVIAGGANMFGSVVLDTRSSEVIAMMGNFQAGQTNTATGQFGYFQPGSSTKQYYYASAFETNGFNPATIMPDLKFVDPLIQKPRTNAIANRFDGPISIRRALQSSLNTVAEETLYLSQTNQNSFAGSEGIKNATDYAKKLGLKFASNEDECIATVRVAIGGCNVSTISHANAMATMLNNGIYNEAKPILEVTQKADIIISKADVNTTYKTNKQTVDAGVVRQTTNVLSDYPTRRSGILSSSAGNFEMPNWNGLNSIAAKSGTAQVDVGGVNRIGDLSAIGGTPYYTALAWTGKINEQKGSTTHNLGDSGSTIVPIWQKIMIAIHEGKAPKGFSTEGLTVTKMDSQTGLIADSKTAKTTDELLTRSQLDILNKVNSGMIKPSNNIFNNRTIIQRSQFKNEFEDDINCLVPLSLFPDRKEFVEQSKSLNSYFKDSQCQAPVPETEKKGQETINSNTSENQIFDKESLIINAIPKDEAIPITNLDIVIRNEKNKYQANSSNSSLIYPVKDIEDGKYSILINTINSKGQKTTKLLKNIEFKKIIKEEIVKPIETKPIQIKPENPIVKPQ